MILGLGGNDIIDAGSGNDILFGWGGDDTLEGDGGNDQTDGKAGPDTITGGTGSDTCETEPPSLVYGVNRALGVTDTGTTGYEYSILGDIQAGPFTLGGSFDPYGQPDNPDPTSLGFGYRNELHVGTQIYLRNRDLDPALGRFTTVDPLEGDAGTTTVAHRYSYAANDPIQRGDSKGLKPTDASIPGGKDQEVSFSFTASPGCGTIRANLFIQADMAPVSGLSRGFIELTRGLGYEIPEGDPIGNDRDLTLPRGYKTPSQHHTEPR